MIIWVNIMHKLLDIDISESHFMINAKNRWKEVHCNDSINHKLIKNAEFHCFLFELLNKKDNKDNKLISGTLGFEERSGIIPVDYTEEV